MCRPRRLRREDDAGGTNAPILTMIRPNQHAVSVARLLTYYLRQAEEYHIPLLDSCMVRAPIDKPCLTSLF